MDIQDLFTFLSAALAGGPNLFPLYRMHIWQQWALSIALWNTLLVVPARLVLRLLQWLHLMPDFFIPFLHVNLEMVFETKHMTRVLQSVQANSAWWRLQTNSERSSCARSVNCSQDGDSLGQFVISWYHRNKKLKISHSVTQFFLQRTPAHCCKKYDSLL